MKLCRGEGCIFLLSIKKSIVNFLGCDIFTQFWQFWLSDQQMSYCNANNSSSKPSKNYIDLNTLNESLNKMKEACTPINDIMGENERRKQVGEVERRFGGTDALDALSREFVKGGTKCTIERTVDCDLCVLFCDCLVYGIKQFFTKAALKFKNLLTIDVPFGVKNESRSSQTPIKYCFKVWS